MIMNICLFKTVTRAFKAELAKHLPTNGKLCINILFCLSCYFIILFHLLNSWFWITTFWLLFFQFCIHTTEWANNSAQVLARMSLLQVKMLSSCMYIFSAHLEASHIPKISQKLPSEDISEENYRVKTTVSKSD